MQPAVDKLHLKSNMDRFIADPYTVKMKEFYVFKIQYG